MDKDINLLNKKIPIIIVISTLSVFIILTGIRLYQLQTVSEVLTYNTNLNGSMIVSVSGPNYNFEQSIVSTTGGRLVTYSLLFPDLQQSTVYTVKVSGAVYATNIIPGWDEIININRTTEFNSGNIDNPVLITNLNSGSIVVRPA